MEALCWLLLAALFIVIEIISLGLTTIWFAGGAFVAALAGLAGVSLTIQVALFLIVSIILLVPNIILMMIIEKLLKGNYLSQSTGKA